MAPKVALSLEFKASSFRVTGCSLGRGAVAVLLLLACAACGSRDPVSQQQAAEVPISAADADGPVRNDIDPALDGTSECIHENYAVRYPEGWQVNDGRILDACSLFDPGPIHVPEASELPPSIAVSIDVEPVSFATIAGEVRGRRDLDREQVMVDGRRAVRIHAESTGEGLHDRGLRSYLYLVDLDGRTMTATTYEAGTLPFERKRRVLDAMMQSLRFLQAEQAPRGL